MRAELKEAKNTAKAAKAEFDRAFAARMERAGEFYDEIGRCVRLPDAEQTERERIYFVASAKLNAAENAVGAIRSSYRGPVYFPC